MFKNHDRTKKNGQEPYPLKADWIFCSQETNVPYRVGYIPGCSVRQSRFKEATEQDIADVFLDFKVQRPRSIATALSETPEEWWIRARNAIGLQSATQLLTF